MKTKRIVLIILGSIILICILLAIYDALVVPPSQRASTYGITEKEKAVLVVNNNTKEFYILDVSIEGEKNQNWPGLISKGENKVFTIPPGEFKLKIHYSDHASKQDLSFMEWYVNSYEAEIFTVKKGRAVIFSLEGGHVSGIFYDKPDLKISTKE